MKGIILAGGAGTRLYPATLTVSKQLMAVYDKPMIYYPLSVLMLAGIKEVLIISTPHDLPNFEKLFADGQELGMKFSYAVQSAPNGLPEAFIIGEKFIGNDPVAMILGDNIFHSAGLTGLLKDACKIKTGGHVFAVHVPDPERFGVVDFDKNGKVTSIEEKPEKPKSNYAVPGLYFFGPEVVGEAKNLKPSARGELEIPDLCRKFLNKGKLKVTVLPRGLAWLDTGTHAAMIKANNYVQITQEMTGHNIACIEEIAYRQGWINDKKLDEAIEKMGKSSYADYLKKIEREVKNEDNIEKGKIDGVLIKELKVWKDNPDLKQEIEPGIFMEVLRDDGEMLKKFGQSNYTIAHEGTIKAFHWHKEQDDLWFLASGRAAIVLYDQRDNSPTKGKTEVIYGGTDDYKLVLIPVGVVHGYKVLSKEPCLLFYHVTKAYNPKNPDELRIDPFDKTINFNWEIL